jgi:Bacteriophage lambda head decoration protein D
MVSTVITIGPYGHFATFIVSESDGYQSREQVGLAGGFGRLVDGTVLGRISVGARSVAAGAAAAWNSAGNATMGTPTVDADAAPGIYRVRFTAATKFEVELDGVVVGSGTTGSAFNGPVNFTITAGGTPMVAGDEFSVAVTAAAGTGAYVPYNALASDGSNIASAILIGDYDTGPSGTPLTPDVAVFVRAGEVQRAMLVFMDTSLGVPATSPQKDAAYASLAVLGTAFR